MHDQPETVQNETGEHVSDRSAEIIIDASRRIYYFPWITDRFIGTSVTRAKLWALSYVGAGFKSMAVMILLTFWAVWWALFNKLIEFTTALKV